MAQLRDFLKRHRPVAVLMGVVLALTALPVLDVYLVLGDRWQGVPPTFTDESFYMARVQTVVEGNLLASHPYFYEHRNDPPLVIFGGTFISAIPQLLGFSLNASLLINFVVWSLLFAAVGYWLFRELRAGPWVSVLATVFVYIQSYSHVWRPANLQPVYPFIFLFYIALLRLIREPGRRNIVFLGLATGATFYLYAFMWQTAVITLGFLFIYALLRKNRSLVRAAFFSLLMGGVIGLPVPLYVLWLSHASPYFWESMRRLGLVDTHLPMAEVIYSGGWIGIALIAVGVFFWRMRKLREDRGLVTLTVFLAISGLGLWVMQGSNFITGKLFETGEHVRLLIQPWIVFALVSIAIMTWQYREHLSPKLRVFSVCICILLAGASAHFMLQRFPPFLPTHVDHAAWHLEQQYAGVFAWLQKNEKEPVVVWVDPHDYLSMMLPVFTRHFTLYTYFGMLELVPEGEIRERYLLSQYFADPTQEYLMSHEEMNLYLGRYDFPHYAKTLERGIKICRILFFWDTGRNCGVPPTPAGVLGDQFFLDLAQKFQTDIKPNVSSYLAKYHVSYILKDTVLNPEYRPETLGATRVYKDARFELYHLSSL